MVSTVAVELAGLWARWIGSSLVCALVRIKLRVVAARNGADFVLLVFARLGRCWSTWYCDSYQDGWRPTWPAAGSCPAGKKPALPAVLIAGSLCARWRKDPRGGQPALSCAP